MFIIADVSPWLCLERNYVCDMAVCDYKVARLMSHGLWFSYFPEVWKPGMKTSRKNGYENLLVKLPERQLWLKDLPGYEKCMKNVWKLPTLRCLGEIVLLLCQDCRPRVWKPRSVFILSPGYENRPWFSYPPKNM